MQKEFRRRLLTGAALYFGVLEHRGESYVELWASYGDVLDPKKQNPDIEWDLVPVTCVIDPIYVHQGRIIWEYNDLLGSALLNTFPDPEVFEEVLNELVVSMSANGKLLSYFLNTPQQHYEFEPDELREITKVYIWSVPRNGAFFEKSRVQYMAALPIFNPSMVSRVFPEDVIRRRLADNVTISTHRLLKAIDEQDDSHLNSIAFAALAGSSGRLDSRYYLNYSQSFRTIHKALTQFKIPEHIDRVYLVVYDELPTIQETNDAIRGLFSMYFVKRFRGFANSNLPVANEFILALPYNLLFVVALVLSHQRLHTLTGPQARREFVAQFAEILGFYTIPISLLYYLLLLVLEHNFGLFIAGEVVLCYASTEAVVWLSNR